MYQEQLWWRHGIIYQIYPRSFKDSNGDGIGDLKGIIQQLDYLEWLGIRAVWLSPIYPSPMADFGYDISDYKQIHPIFGEMHDLESLLDELHRRNMKLILDLVPNHTSSQHPWFIESKSSKDSPKRSWYIWEDAKPDGSAPNNWLSVFGGSAWEWDEDTQQYYYHAFLKEQPDLNWRNEDVQKAMLEVMQFWLEKGVDGFRVDVMWHLIKDKQLRDNPLNPDFQERDANYNRLLPVYSTDQPEVHELVGQMRALLEQYQEKVLIGEIYLPIQRLVTYYGINSSGAHLPFNFQLLTLPWDAQQIAVAIDEYEGAIPENGWPNWVLSNHDKPRIASRIGGQQARVAAFLLLTLRGTPTIYYGDEIGMYDVPIPSDEVQDPQGLNMPGKNLSRDPARTPMQWNNGEFAGFSTVKPWLRVDKRFKRENVEIQKDNPYSMLTLYRKLIKLRNEEPTLQYGNYVPIFSDQQLIIYKRALEGYPTFLIALNLTPRPAYFKQQGKTVLKGEVILATTPETEGLSLEEEIYVGGDEALVIRLEKNKTVSAPVLNT
ncbi:MULTISPECIES: alpha-amylase family glycosyl hydrolase [Olivibacter]|jgi:alpha-glucosidase|uniref:Alpha amylase catalytic region n=3 Tax=Sphingobacteriaceae TaxID=84566 RepID=F4C7A8_SPHS2|nr:MULTISPECIES: alpha-amylase family glycosyl hydrolase [Olivibacter]MCL4638144.1 alpha-amylase family glycosyl hydrolase [Olivibacter sp. UJ_SKK_5.1]MDM8175546.1 alpha-amylase family glycosyl hydrolase [Olivibacter sp. 47]MDX3914155.1 alpha-amylase family glycosyl hydrolase [Pseudosphingobacterium sp.]QEL02294.1 DUF3459 domain-containing protein [Olivibacter sp. LS-1]